MNCKLNTSKNESTKKPKTMSKTVITPTIAKYIEQNYLKESSRIIASKFGISKTAVLNFKKKKVLVVPKTIIDLWKSTHLKKPYNELEQNYIIKHIATKTIKEIALDLGRSSTTLSEECHRLGLTEVIDYKKQASRYKPGHVPHSKGKKMTDFMSPETVAKFKSNQYKQGSVPHNALSNGTEVFRKDTKGRVYVLIKVPEHRRLQYKHRLVWELNYGEIPSSHNIIFKDGDPFNCNIENLQCVSNVELMKMNSFHDLPPDLKELIYLKSAISRQINKYSK